MTHFIVFDLNKSVPANIICNKTGRWAILSGKFRNEAEAIAEASARRMVQPGSLVAEKGRYIFENGKVIRIHYGPVKQVDLIYDTKPVATNKAYPLAESIMEGMIKAGTHQRSKFKFRPSNV